MNDHIAILNKFNNFKAELSSLTKPSLVEKPLTDKIVDKKLSTRTQINKPSLSETKKQPSSVLIDNKEQKVKVNEPSQKVNTKQLSAELLNLQSEMKCKEIINLTNNVQMPSCSKGNPHDNIGSQWTQVTHSKSAASRRKRMIVGNNKESTIKGVRKLAYLHVCRVDLGTSAMDLQDSLKFDLFNVNQYSLSILIYICLLKSQFLRKTLKKL